MHPSDPKQPITVEELIPLLVPAVRRAVSSSIRQVFRSFNRLVVRSLTLRGLAWRIDAWRTGTPFEELIRRRNTIHPVAEVFLIHRDTGLLLQEARGDEANSQDGDMVSGMLSAIQDFVRDSFVGQDNDKLHTVEVGDMTLCVEQGPLAILAGVVHGEVPSGLRSTFRGVLNQIHARHSKELANFAGDTLPFHNLSSLLGTCLRIETIQMDGRPSPVTVALLVAPLVAIALWCLNVRIQQRRWQTYLGLLSAERGIVVLEEGRRHGAFYIRGLRDPLAPQPNAMLPEAGVDPASVSSFWTQYHALDNALCIKRARLTLKPPVGISLSLHGGRLIASGAATRDWLDDSLAAATTIPGVESFDTALVEVVDRERAMKWRSFLDQLQAEPGLVVVEHGTRDGKFFLAGLRDPLAMDPWVIMQETGPEPSDAITIWQTYQSLAPELVLVRAKLRLQPPQAVSLTFTDGVLSAAGEAPNKWISTARTVVPSLPGVAEFDTAKLTNVDFEHLLESKRSIEGRAFCFLVGSPSLWPGQKREMDGLASDVRALLAAGKRLDREVSVEIRGHADASGDDAADMRTAESLSRRFLEAIAAQVSSRTVFTVRAMGSEIPDIDPAKKRDPAHNRLVTFRVIGAEMSR